LLPFTSRIHARFSWPCCWSWLAESCRRQRLCSVCWC
jgi:hypothetical protein